MNQMTNSHILVNEFDYLEPASLDEAIALLKQYGDRAQVAAGGTNLVIWMKMEQCAPAYVINVGKLPGLTGLSFQDEGLRVGPLTTIRALRNAPRVQATYTGLAEACAAFGSAQIQMMGTVGGNVCNGSPASDTVPALLAFDAQLTLTGPAGKRNLPIADFLLGPGQTALQPDELLTGIHLPQPQPGTGSAFVKISRVAADLAKASAAAVIVRRGDEIVACRLAFGSVSPTVLRAHRAEQLLAGQTFSAELALEAGQVASEEVTPIDDVRSTARYRRQVIRALTHDVLQLAWERAGSQAQDSEVEKPKTPPTTAPGHQGVLAKTLHVAHGETHEIELTVNGRRHRLAVRPNELLLNVLRERLGLTGSKYGCGLGECGACTVHLDGQPALACLVLAVAADGREVLTVEGLQGPNGELSPLQQAFIEHNAFQCGYCTPGMLMMTQKLLEEIPAPSEDDVRDYLKGNRCRCTGFASIVRAVLSAGRPVDR
ncbi:MAG TPA: 2Fe-2S iron-sulfur cluster binding domain-containing protein [Chloroflexi bacterium]|nr:2Fe-2S iron-sulfur cluster binding domain-containing protein [Chloroflexota bacterium]